MSRLIHCGRNILQPFGRALPPEPILQADRLRLAAPGATAQTLRHARLRLEAASDVCPYCHQFRWAHADTCQAFHRNGERRR